MKTHTGEKNHKCATCDKEFTRREGLRVHMRWHTGERPYKCEVCGKGFVTQSKLTKHMRVHERKPYICQDCKKGFSTISSLRNHTHIGGKTTALPPITSITDVETFQCSDGQTVIRIQPEPNLSVTEVSSTGPTASAGQTLNRTSTNSDSHSSNTLNESETDILQISSVDCTSSKPSTSSGETRDRTFTDTPSNCLLQKKIAPALDLGTFLINSVFVKILEGNSILNGQQFSSQITSGDSNRDSTPVNGTGRKSPTTFTGQDFTANQRRECDSHSTTNSEAIAQGSIGIVSIDHGDDTISSTLETVAMSRDTNSAPRSTNSVSQFTGEKSTTVGNQNTENVSSNSQDEVNSGTGNSIPITDIGNTVQHVAVNSCGTNSNSDIENMLLDSSSNRDTPAIVQCNPPLILPNITIVTHPGNQPPPCPICNKSFSKPCDLTKHMYTHMNDKPYKCETCKCGFDDSSELDEHDCSMNKSFECSECLETFFTFCAFEAHIDKEHPHLRTAKPYKCDDCDKKFCSGSSLKVHRRIHTGERPFPCTVCDMKFIDSSSRTIHMRKHTGERPFPCKFCDLKFMDSSSRRIHTRNHTGERPFHCQFCVKRFPTRTRLIVHVRTHTGERPYKCQVCGRGFYRKFVLTVHMRTHTGEKPYRCEHCEKSFTCSVDRRRHQEDVHEGRRLKCEQCGKEFKRAAFSRHIRVKHKEQVGSVMEAVENVNTT